MTEKPLCGILPGETAFVRRLCGGSGICRRLLDMGLTEGGAVTCLYRSPSGDPTAYLVRGAVIALRREDAAGITVFSI